jgi:hypothetical protein
LTLISQNYQWYYKKESEQYHREKNPKDTKKPKHRVELKQRNR